jgi:hypothetical protein
MGDARDRILEYFKANVGVHELPTTGSGKVRRGDLRP